MTNRIQLEPEAQAFAEAAARSPLLFTLGPQQGRLALDEAQSGKVRKPAVDMEDLTITDGPSPQVVLRAGPLGDACDFPHLWHRRAGVPKAWKIAWVSAWISS